MEDIKNQLVTRLKEANNVLVAVTNNPSVDQLAAAIALTLVLNKLNKHATTVFSGTIPSTIEFLKPEKAIEKTTDSLRDFIISLDKTKADKLRYKIEDQFVKIFITPYHTSISENDLVFSHGDFNVDVVIGLGVQQREELDQAITSHGRILHDATVATITTEPPSTLGSINFADSKSSSLCEILVGLLPLISKDNILDEQIATAFLTGIVAETQRFSNQRTMASTMTASSKLLAAGANQQLVAKELTPQEEPEPVPIPEVPPEPLPEPEPDPQPLPPVKEEPKPKEPAKDDAGTLQIDHTNEENQLAQVLIDEQGTLKTVDETPAESETGNSQPVAPDPGLPTITTSSISSLETTQPERDDTKPPEPGSFDVPASELPALDDTKDLHAILGQGNSDAQPTFGESPKLVIQPPPQPELKVDAFDSNPSPGSSLDDHRSAVDAAYAANPDSSVPTPDQALNATPVDLNFGNHEPSTPGDGESPVPPPVPPPPILPPDMTAL